MGKRSSEGGGVWFTTFKSHESFSPFLLISWDSSRIVKTPSPPREVLPISWDLQTKNINRLYFLHYNLKKSTFSWDLAILKSHESISPFLLISWYSSRFVQTQTPPREVLPISWDLQTKNTNKTKFLHCIFKKSTFSWGLAIFKSHESFSPFLLISWDSFIINENNFFTVF